MTVFMKISISPIHLDIFSFSSTVLTSTHHLPHLLTCLICLTLDSPTPPQYQRQIFGNGTPVVISRCAIVHGRGAIVARAPLYGTLYGVIRRRTSGSGAAAPAAPGLVVTAGPAARLPGGGERRTASSCRYGEARPPPAACVSDV